MRTKTLALSAVLSALGTVSLVAQSNVYSVNSVGYINVTMPPGFSIITCPLIVGTDTEYAGAYGGPAITNDLNVVLNNDNGQYHNASVTSFANGGSFLNVDVGNSLGAGGGWGGTTSLPAGSPAGTVGLSDIGEGIQLLPGQAVFFNTPAGPAMTATFVGTVPQGSLTNILVKGFNLVGSMVPASGDLVANSITGPFFASEVNQSAPSGTTKGPANGDSVLTYGSGAYVGNGGWSGSWSLGLAPSGGPLTTSVSQGFFYSNAGKDGAPAQTINGYSAPAGTEVWVENFSVNP
jgi:hypothetical protein